MNKYYYVFMISGQDKNLFVGSSVEILVFLDTYQNQPDKNQNFPHFNDKLVYYERFESAEGAERRKQEIIRMDDGQKKKLVKSFNPRWESLIARLTREGVQQNDQAK